MKSKTKSLAIFTLFMAFLISVLGFGLTGAINKNAVADEVIVEKIYTITTAEELTQFATSVNQGNDYAGETVTLASDITLSGDWTSIGNGARSGTGYTGNAFKGTFDGNGKTISGLNASLFGIVDGGTVQNLNLDVNINATGDAVGAVTALIFNGGKVSGVNVKGSIVGVEGVGGVVGRIILQGTVENCTNDATVTATSEDAAGGIVGKAYYTKADIKISITGCTNNGAVTSPYAAGGIAGFSAAVITDCTNTGAVTGGVSAGGIVGEQTNYGEISTNKNSADISADIAGGIVGWVRYQINAAAYPVSAVIKVIGNENSGNINGYDGVEGDLSSAGGIVGHVYNQATVTDNSNTASYIVAETFAAGILGTLQTNTDNLVIQADNCKIGGNTSTTVNIKANCVDALVYNNTGDSGILEIPEGTTNTVPAEEELAQVAEVETVYTSFTDAWNAAMENGGTLTLLDDVTIGENGEESGNAGAVAKVETNYASLAEAVAAAPSGSTVTLLCDDLGTGLVIRKDLTIDFGGNTYTVNEGVGSEGTETLAIQVLAGSNAAPYDVTLKNGTVKVVETPVEGSKEIMVVIMNYSNLTLEDITVDGTGNTDMVCAFATNNGKAEIKGETNLMVNDGVYAVVDVDGSQDYYGNAEIVINTTGTITGNVEIYGNEANVQIDAGTFDGEFTVAEEVETGAVTVTGGSFTDENVTTYVAAGESVTVNEKEAIGVGAVIDGVSYWTLADAINAANENDGKVTVEIYGKVEYTAETANLSDSLDVITFVGKTKDAEISITRNGSAGYISGSGTENAPAVNFESLILSKPDGAWAPYAAFMSVYFTVYRVKSVTYTNCVFPDGACAQGCPVTYTDCDFANDTNGEYSLWVYASTTVTVTDSKFTGVRGVKMYSEAAAIGGEIDNEVILNNTEFTESVTEKPAIVLTYGAEVTLKENTYPATGVFELDADGKPNGTTVDADIADIACAVEIDNEMVDCGVLVDGKIYTTLTQAVEESAVTNESKVTLMYNAEDEIAIPGGAEVDTNGYEFTRVKAGDLPAAYVNGTSVWGEAYDLNAQTSVVFKLYFDEKLLATMNLNDVDDIIDGEIPELTWHFYTIESTDEYWTIVWEENARIWNVVPSKVELYVDDALVDTATVQLNGPDDTNPINWWEVEEVEGAPVIITDKDGNIVSKYGTLQEAINAVKDGQTVTLYELFDKDALYINSAASFTLDLGGKSVKFAGDNQLNGEITIKNGTIDITGTVAKGDAIFNIGAAQTATLTLEDITLVGDGYSSAYAVFFVRGESTLNIIDSTVDLKNDTAAYPDGSLSGGFIKSHDAAKGKVNLTSSTINLTNAQIGILDGTVVMDDVTLTIKGSANAINQSALTIKNSTVTIANCNGRAITLNDGDVTIENSTLTLSGATEGEIRYKASKNISIDEKSSIKSVDGDQVNIWADDAAKNATITVAGNDAVIILGTEDVQGQVAKEADSTEYTLVNPTTRLLGEGTEDNPYVISTVEQLNWFAEDVNGGNDYAGQFVKLTADLTIGVWEPIGSKETPFKGTFDGDNHTVSDMFVVEVEELFGSNASHSGFFGYTTAATVKNLTLENVHIKGGAYVGAIVGEAFTGTIENCHVIGIQIEGTYNVGGITGAGYPNIINCSVVGNGPEQDFVTAYWKMDDYEGDSVGGIIGFYGENTGIEGIEVNNCSVKNITVSGTRKVGGIAGSTFRCNEFINCSVENVIIKTTASVEYATAKKDSMGLGGIVGLTNNDYEGGSITEATVDGVTFEIPEELDGMVSAGAIIGGHRVNDVAVVEVTDMDIEQNTVENVVGATTFYSVPEFYVNEEGYWVIKGVTTDYKAIGEDGVTPQLRINEDTNYWEVSYDGGKTWESLDIKATGEAGKDGTDGEDGVGVEKIVINEKGELVITYTDGSEVNLGKVTGEDGKDGAEGEDGVGVEKIEINAKGELVITYTDGSEVNLGKVIGDDGADGTKGEDGADGNDGVGVEKIVINEKGELVITYTDGKEVNLGKVTGEDGKDGAEGEAGADGNDGAAGADGITPQLRINTDTNEWEVSYDGGKTWTSLGVKATGEAGKDGSNGDNAVSVSSMVLTSVSIMLNVLVVVWVSMKLRKK